MNLKNRAVELRTSKHTTDPGALQKGEDFVKAFSLGFDVDDVSWFNFLIFDEFLGRYVAGYCMRIFVGDFKHLWSPVWGHALKVFHKSIKIDN